MKTEDWAIMASDFVEGLENEAKADHKKFYNVNDGRARVKSTIAKLDALRPRLSRLA